MKRFTHRVRELMLALLAITMIAQPVTAQIDPSVTGLPAASTPADNDILEIRQGGQRKATTLTSVMSGVLPNALDANGIASMASRAGDVGPAINLRLQQMSAFGCGILNLGRGSFETNVTIVIPSKCGLAGAGKEATSIRKGPSFPDGAPLIDMSGGPGSAAGENHKTGMSLANLQLLAAGKTGLLVSADYTSTSTFTAIRMSGAPGAALQLREAWDHCFYDLQINSSGGILGDSDAVIRILGSAADRSNLLRFFGLRIETFRNEAVFISDDGFGSGAAPYAITFYGPKLESGLLVDNAVPFKSTQHSLFITLHDYYGFLGSNVARTGIRALDLDGGGHVIDGAMVSIGNNVTLASVVRAPRTTAGGRIRDLRVVGASTVAMLVEMEALRADSNPNIYNERAMMIERLAAFGSVPLIGGTGADTIGYQFPQKEGSVSTIAATGSRNLRWTELNRVVNFNSSSAGTLTLPGDPFGYDGDVAEIVQVGAGAATLAVFGGTLIVPTNLSATTNGVGSSVRARRVGANVWRVF